MKRFLDASGLTLDPKRFGQVSGHNSGPSIQGDTVGSTINYSCIWTVKYLSILTPSEKLALREIIQRQASRSQRC